MGSRGSSSMTSSGHEGNLGHDVERVVGQWTDDSIDLRLESANGVEMSADAKILDDWLQDGSFDGTLYRGVTLSREQINSFEVGDVIDQDGISSWSQSRMVAEDFAKQSTPLFELMNQGQANGDVIFKMNGTKRGRSTAEFSDNPEEEEVTVSASSRQRITGISTHAGRVTVTLEEIA